MMMSKRVSNPHIRWFDEIGIGDVALVGGKNASLGEMYRELTPKGVKVPNGFAVTADAYRYFLRETGVDRRLREVLQGLGTRDIENLRQRGRQARDLILEADLPQDLQQAMTTSYEKLSEGTSQPLDVAVRSSATAEDLPDASFAGQQETYLNVRGNQALLETCKRCFASLYTDRAISYRVDKGFDHFKVGLSIVAHLFDERNPAVMRTIEEVIRRARACGRKIGICGQAPSDYPEFARFLVSCGIDSISLNPDTVLKTTGAVLDMEKQLREHPSPAPTPAKAVAAKKGGRAAVV